MESLARKVRVCNHGRKRAELLNALFAWPIVKPAHHLLHLVQAVAARIPGLSVEPNSSAGIVCWVRRNEQQSNGSLHAVLTLNVEQERHQLVDHLDRQVPDYAWHNPSTTQGWSELLSNVGALTLCPRLPPDIINASTMTASDQLKFSTTFDGKGRHVTDCRVAYRAGQGKGGRHKVEMCSE
jgi:hypothetical protein